MGASETDYNDTVKDIGPELRWSGPTMKVPKLVRGAGGDRASSDHLALTKIF
jgi:hypothetical protein